MKTFIIIFLILVSASSVLNSNASNFLTTFRGTKESDCKRAKFYADQARSTQQKLDDMGPSYTGTYYKSKLKSNKLYCTRYKQKCELKAGCLSRCFSYGISDDKIDMIKRCYMPFSICWRSVYGDSISSSCNMMKRSDYSIRC